LYFFIYLFLYFNVIACNESNKQNCEFYEAAKKKLEEGHQSIYKNNCIVEPRQDSSSVSNVILLEPNDHSTPNVHKNHNRWELNSIESNDSAFYDSNELNKKKQPQQQQANYLTNNDRLVQQTRLLGIVKEDPIAKSIAKKSLSTSSFPLNGIENMSSMAECIDYLDKLSECSSLASTIKPNGFSMDEKSLEKELL
jgi:hypothetical protein